MSSVTWFLIGLGTGFVLNTLVALRFSWRFVVRLRQADHLETLAETLEKRRAARDFGRQDQVRPDAGLAGNETNLFPARPGRQVLNRLAEKLPKGVDTQPDSTILTESGSNHDQQIAKG